MTGTNNEAVDIIDFLQDMIANYLADESLAQAIAAFMADHPDSESTGDFAAWADGTTPESSAHKMTLPGDDNVCLTDFIADDDLPSFCDFAEKHFGFGCTGHGFFPFCGGFVTLVHPGS